MRSLSHECRLWGGQWFDSPSLYALAGPWDSTALVREEQHPPAFEVQKLSAAAEAFCCTEKLGIIEI